MEEDRTITIKGAFQRHRTTLKINPRKTVLEMDKELDEAATVFFDLLLRQVPGGIWDRVKGLMEAYEIEKPNFPTEEAFQEFVSHHL